MPLPKNVIDATNSIANSARSYGSDNLSARELYGGELRERKSGEESEYKPLTLEETGQPPWESELESLPDETAQADTGTGKRRLTRTGCSADMEAFHGDWRAEVE